MLHTNLTRKIYVKLMHIQELQQFFTVSNRKIIVNIIKKEINKQDINSINKKSLDNFIINCIILNCTIEIMKLQL